MEKKPSIEGVFSTQELRRVGTGTTTRKTIQKSYWYAKEMALNSIEVQPLNANYVPSGPKRTVTKNFFLERFAPEPEFYFANVLPKVRELNKTIARGDRHRRNREFYSAEMEYNNALTVDEDNIRANFGLGITYLERGEDKKAEDILNRIVKLDAAFETQHKHLFNEFGIKLRKSGLFAQSVSYYTRALALTRQDEHLYYNIARASLEQKDYASAVDYLLQGLSINPLQDTLIQCLEWMVEKELIPEAKKNEAAEMLIYSRSAMDAAKSTPTAQVGEESAAP